LFLLVLSAKYRFLTSLQKEGKSNPALSIFCRWQKTEQVNSGTGDTKLACAEFEMRL
jgi:hypothetical protein